MIKTSPSGHHKFNKMYLKTNMMKKKKHHDEKKITS
jgi:hypothetical protein